MKYRVAIAVVVVGMACGIPRQASAQWGWQQSGGFNSEVQQQQLLLTQLYQRRATLIQLIQQSTFNSYDHSYQVFKNDWYYGHRTVIDNLYKQHNVAQLNAYRIQLAQVEQWILQVTARMSGGY